MGEKMHTFRIYAMGELGIFEGDVFNGLALEGSHKAIRSVARNLLEPVVIIPASSHDKLVEALRDVVTFAHLYHGKMESTEGDEALAALGETALAALSRHGEGK